MLGFFCNKIISLEYVIWPIKSYNSTKETKSSTMQLKTKKTTKSIKFHTQSKSQTVFPITTTSFPYTIRSSTAAQNHQVTINSVSVS